MPCAFLFLFIYSCWFYSLSCILCLFKLDPLQHIWETSCSVTDPVFSYHSSNNVRHISLYLASLYCILQILSFYKLKFCKHFVASNSVGTIFPITPAHFVSLYHILPILAVFQSFSLLLYLLRWSVISDLWCCYYNLGGGKESHPGKAENLVDKCYMYSAAWLFFISLPFLRTPCSLGHIDIETGPLNNPALASRGSSKKKSHLKESFKWL